MLAYNIEKSRIGDFGFDTLNLFTNDEVHCSEFRPTDIEIEAIAVFLRGVSNLFCTNRPISLYISKKGNDFLVDAKVYANEDPIFGTEESPSLETALLRLSRKMAILSTH